MEKESTDDSGVYNGFNSAQYATNSTTCIFSVC